MKKLMIVAMTALVGLGSIDAYAWGNAAKKAAKAEAKAEKSSEKQKNAIKNWQMTRYRYMDVQAAVQRNGKLSTTDIPVVCNLEEAQPILDALLAGYVTIVNIVDAYVDIEEGNAVVGLVTKKMDIGKSRSEAESGLSADEKAAYNKYLDWLKDGKNTGKIAIADEDLEKLMNGASTVKEQLAEIKEKVKGRKGAKMSLVKDGMTAAKIAGSATKGGLLLKGILDREKKAKKLIAEEK